MLDAVRWASSPSDSLPGKLRLLDQTRLPVTVTYMETDDLETICRAIKDLVVRGAPAIGCAAALGLTAVSQHSGATSAAGFLDDVRRHADTLGQSRPTAVNLRWALKRCVERLEVDVARGSSVGQLKEALLQEGLAILREDMGLCRAIGENGLDLFRDAGRCRVLTHCNAGALATSDYGTALSPVYCAWEAGMETVVYADETRPLLQGSRLTAWELVQAGVPVTVVCDSMAAQVLREGKVDAVIVGADRIAANGDVANKIGTYGLAVNAHYHQIPFYVAAPYSTIDMALQDGAEIPIEQRDPEEIRRGFGRQTAPDDCSIYNPAFDVTPASLVSAIITEHAVLRPPFDQAISTYMRERDTVSTGAW